MRWVTLGAFGGGVSAPARGRREPTLDSISFAVAALTLATTLSSNQSDELIFLFVVLPFLVAGLVIWFVSWRSSHKPAPIRTSTILAEGQSAQAEVLSVKPLGSFLEVRPMVRFVLRVRADSDEPFDLEVIQSLPRGAVRDFHAGDVIEVRLTPDHSAGAVVWGWPSAG